jgi:hypothetical protein
LSRDLGIDPPLTADRVRKSLQRARERLAELLVDEVAASKPRNLEQLLSELGILDYCRDAIRRRQ